VPKAWGSHQIGDIKHLQRYLHPSLSRKWLSLLIFQASTSSNFVSNIVLRRCHRLRSSVTCIRQLVPTTIKQLDTLNSRSRVNYSSPRINTKPSISTASTIIRNTLLGNILNRHSRTANYTRLSVFRVHRNSTTCSSQKCWKPIVKWEYQFAGPNQSLGGSNLCWR
jgi:hypothetical protein